MSSLNTNVQARPTTSTIRSATGLSRAALASVYREIGIFGRDSDLTAAEQAIVQNRLGPLPGIPARPATTWLTPRLRALIDYADALIAGQDVTQARNTLERRGFTRAALSEVQTTVSDVQEVFGPRTRPVRQDVREDRLRPVRVEAFAVLAA